jgi:hypothetical protein
MKPEVRQWHIIVEDSAGESYQVTDSYLVGTFSELTRVVELAVEQWEARTGLFAERIELESHGKVAK